MPGTQRPTAGHVSFYRSSPNSLGTIVAVFSLISGGCTVPPLNQSDAEFPQGSTVQLNQPVTIPAGSVGAYIGPGMPETRQQYPATCRLEGRTVQRNDATFQPDQFLVTGTSYQRDALTGPTYPSTLSGFYSLGEGPGLVYFDTLVYLQSENQPDVLRLKCRQLRDGYAYGYLSREQIREILGQEMTLSP
jgi:hypothetical protein